MGAQIVKEVSTKTNDVAGDGTTTPPCWPRPWSRGPEEPGCRRQPYDHEEGIARATAAAVDAIKANSKTVNGSEDIARVGTVSSGDEDHRQADRRGHGKGLRRRRHHR